MLTLLLIRHGIAEDSAGSDAARALTTEGWNKTRAAMRGLVMRGYTPSRGISSPFRRAAETMICLQEATEHGFPVGFWEGLIPSGTPASAEEWLRGELAVLEEPSIVAVVSHEPLLSTLIRHLTGRSIEVKKASCTVLHWTGEAFKFVVHLPPAALRDGYPVKR